LTPEEVFRGDAPCPQWEWGSFDLTSFQPGTLLDCVVFVQCGLLCGSAASQLLNPSSALLVATSSEVVLMQGFPASGKSTFAKKYLEAAGYVYVNQVSVFLGWDSALT